MLNKEVICEKPIPDADLEKILDQAEEFVRKLKEDHKRAALPPLLEDPTVLSISDAVRRGQASVVVVEGQIVSSSGVYFMVKAPQTT